MDVAALATALISAQVGQFQLAAAARLARMNADMASSVAQLLGAADQSAQPLANVAAGIGTNLDITA